MSWGRITPTDIDGFVEFGDRVFVFIESKFNGAPMPRGQRLALERLADAVGVTKHCLLAVCRHSCGPDEEIPMHACVVTEYRTRRMWRTPKSDMLLGALVDKFLAHANKDGG